jgi:hypothetical protein
MWIAKKKPDACTQICSSFIDNKSPPWKIMLKTDISEAQNIVNPVYKLNKAKTHYNVSIWKH